MYPITSRISATGTVAKYQDLYLKTWYKWTIKERAKKTVAKAARANEGV